ncbi:MAG TPA: laccase domain-containing protein, partial [Actinomycetota bacterium]|nr:laccase domain-containing protein [Actinomycetota bacterium]
TVRVGGARHFDLRAASAAALAAAGVRLAGSTDVPCTACDARFFSHRRDSAAHGTTGRQGLIAWLEGGEPAR